MKLANKEDKIMGFGGSHQLLYMECHEWLSATQIICVVNMTLTDHSVERKSLPGSLDCGTGFGKL